VFFAGKRIAVASGGAVYYYAEDFLGSSRAMVQSGTTAACYDADFYPFGGERDVVANCNPVYKFEGKERDAETQNDDFGARYYSWRFGRWESADWSSVPVAVPYANLANPQTLNLYAMAGDNPETFADLDGHQTAYDPAGSDPPANNATSTNEDYVVKVFLFSFFQIVHHTRAPDQTKQQEQTNQILAQQTYGRQPDGS
jgi:RHS repeat-associated protein